MGEAKRRKLAGTYPEPGARNTAEAIAAVLSPDLTEAEANRLADAAETEGCECCGALFASGLPQFIVRHPGGGYGNRCLDCRTLGDAVPVNVCIPLGPEPWTEDDRTWFAANPARNWRLREPMRGELAALRHSAGADPDGMAEWVAAGRRAGIVVYQAVPGRRLRMTAKLFIDDPLDSYTEAGIIALLNKEALATAEAWRAEVPDYEAERRDFLRQFKRRLAVAKPFIVRAR
jgi:hypothetical protein